MHTCTYIHTCIHTYIHTYIHAYMHTCIHTYVRTYTCILSTLGLGLYRKASPRCLSQGHRRLGCAILPESARLQRREVKTLRDHWPWTGPPSFVSDGLHELQWNGVDLLCVVQPEVSGGKGFEWAFRWASVLPAHSLDLDPVVCGRCYGMCVA